MVVQTTTVAISMERNIDPREALEEKQAALVIRVRGEGASTQDDT